jgi:hypothetical protein
MTSTKADVVAKFKELHQKHYMAQGFMVSNVPDETSEKVFADAAVWRETYNRYASEHVNIRSLSVTVPILGHGFTMQFERPLVKDHHCEFEEYFGFGGHCKGFTLNRTVARFPSKFDAELNIDALLLQDAADPIDADYAKSAIMLLALGGYVKYWTAIREFEQWFADVAGVPECKGFSESKELLARIFEGMTMVMVAEPPLTPT